MKPQINNIDEKLYPQNYVFSEYKIQVSKKIFDKKMLFGYA